MKYTSNSTQDTAKIAKQLAEKFKNRGGLITLQGPLGAGKTTFTQSFARSLGIKDRIISPTFILSREYQIPHSPITLYHLDLYRLENSDELKSLNLDELLSNPNNLLLIEWPEKLATSYQEKISTSIIIQPVTTTKRTIQIS